MAIRSLREGDDGLQTQDGMAKRLPALRRLAVDRSGLPRQALAQRTLNSTSGDFDSAVRVEQSPPGGSA